MGLSQINDDLMYLAGRLLHRSAQSEYEREAALYIKGRLGEYTPDVSLEPFHAAENYPHLFASYMAEFLIVGALSFWWPEVAFGYGLGVFILYLTEFCGFKGLSRFMPQYPSQNVVARFLGVRPKCTIIVSAYYDSGCASSLTTEDNIRWLRPVHWILVVSMIVVMATCATDALTVPDGGPNSVSFYVRWGAIGILGLAALTLFVVSSRGEDIRGANNNASGVAALLGIAEKLHRSPVEDSDILLVATGSHEAWMSGMRNFLSSHRFPKGNTYILNIESVGTGRLHYLKQEGFLYALSASSTMTGLANALSSGRPVRAGKLRAVPTEAHVPLSLGMKSMTLIALDQSGLPAYWNQIGDRVTEVETTNIAEIIEFSAKFVQELAQEHARQKTS